MKIDEKIIVRRSEERGHVNHGWLDAYHSFSFGDYYDPKNMHFRTMRVLNEDRIGAGQGFSMHPHEDMEIITYILEGALEHKDNMHNSSVIEAGEVQRMSAGTGVIHSEINPKHDTQTHLFQIWILPNEKGIKPSYEQKKITRDKKLNQLRLIASPSGSAEAVRIHQDVNLYASILEAGNSLSFEVKEGRYFWLQLASGVLTVNQEVISVGDAIAVSHLSKLNIQAEKESEFLLFDLK